MDIWSVGVGLWLTRFFNENMNYRRIGLDRFGFDSDALMTRVLILLE